MSRIKTSLCMFSFCLNLDNIQEIYGQEVREYPSMIECDRWTLGANVKATRSHSIILKYSRTSCPYPNPFPLYGWKSTNFVESENNLILVNSLRKSNPFDAIRTGCIHLLNEFTSRQKLAHEFLTKSIVITHYATKIL